MPDAPRVRPAWMHAALLVALCAAMFLPRLSDGGLSYTEGHRAIPAWEMLESGDWFVTTMFDRVYMRKPPGMPWAIGVSSLVFGQTEFAARFVSALCATGMVLVAYGFARRWFGARWALAAGLAQLLWPLMWDTARTAEIEAMNNLFSQLSAFLIIDLCVFKRKRRAVGATAWTIAMIVSLVGVALAKGPAGMPVVLAAAAGCCMTLRSPRALLHPALGVAVLLSVGVIAGMGALILTRLADIDAEPVTQSAKRFLWDPGNLLGIALLVPSAFIAALPVSIAVLFPFGADASNEWRGDPRALRAARALGWTVAIGLVGMMVMGVGNVRYTMPVIVVASPLVAYVFCGWAGAFDPVRRRDAKLALLGSPFVWVLILVLAFAAFMLLQEPPRRASSGREVAGELSEVLPDSGELWANTLVESRPETLWYAAQDKPALRVKWGPWTEVRLAFLEGKMIALCVGDEFDPDGDVKDMSGEELLLSRIMKRPRFEQIFDGTVHKYRFVVCRLRGVSGDGTPP